MKGKIWKQILALILALGMILGDFPIGFAIESHAAADSANTCGENATWTYEDGILTVEGTGAMTDYTKSSDTPWYQYKSEIKEVIIGDEITSVGDYAFSGLESLETIVLGVNVTRTGFLAFWGTTPKSITLPNEDFENEASFPVYSYSSAVHDYFSTIKIRKDAVAVNESILNHSDVEAFQVIEAADETAAVNYASSDGVLYNADYSTLIAYPARRQNAEYTVAESTKSLNEGAFYGSYYIEKVTLPEGIEIIPEDAFYSCESLKEVNIPDTVTNIEDYAFAGCYALENVIIGEGVTDIGDYAFNGCYAVKVLKFGRNVSTIGAAAFSPLSSGGAVALSEESGDEPIIEEMLIPVKEVTMEPDSFEGTDARKVSLYSDTVFGEDSVFLTFPGTEEFEVIGLSADDAVARYKERDGVLFDCGDTELTSYPKAKKDTEHRIPEGITDIRTKAFYNADYLEKLYIPDSVDFIGADAFTDCDNLTIYCSAGSYAAQYAKDNAIPYSINANNIEFTLLKNYSVGLEEEPIVYDDRISDYAVTITKNDVRITGCKINKNNILLPPEQVEAGDVIKISLTSLEGDTLDYTTEVTLDDNRYAEAEFEVLQKGRFEVSPIATAAVSIIVFDMEGNRIDSTSDTDGSYISGFYDAGSYQVMLLYGEDANWPYDTLAEFQENRFIGDAYALQTVQITDNVVTDLGEINVEEIDVMSALYLDEDTCYFANTDVVSQNGLIQVKAEYQFIETDEEISPQTLRITIQENCSYVSGSMKMDGEFTDQITETDNDLTVQISKLSGTITFNLKPTDYGTIQSSAILKFETEKGMFEAGIGTIEIIAPYISLETVTKTKQEEIVVSGVTIPETEITIYDGAYKVGTAKSSKSGRWSETVKLVDAWIGSVHDIKAVINAGTEEEKQSNTVDVLYESTVEILEFKMYYNNKRKEVDLLNLPKSKRFISYIPQLQIDFKVRLSDNDQVETVYIVSTKGTKEQLLEMEYNESEDCWVTSNRFKNSTPGILSVRVIEKAPDLQVDKDVEFYVDSSDMTNALKDSEYKEIVNEYDQETGIGNYEGSLTLADEGETTINVKITGKEVETDNFTETELLNKGYIKTESTDGATDYYSKIETLENGDFELKTVEVQYGALDAVHSVTQQSAILVLGKAVEDVGKEEFGEIIGSALGDTFGVLTDSAGYVDDFLAEDGIYNRINYAYEYLTDAYTNHQISAKVYSEKLTELETMNDALLFYQSMKLILMGVGAIGGFMLPGGALAFALISGALTGLSYEYFDTMFEAAFADLYNIQLCWTIDPSGYVYEGIPDNRLEGVTATIYYQEKDEDDNISAVCWNAEEYEQINPQITDEDGAYAWDVPEGYWKVIFEKEGYETAETDWLPVPPIQTDVNIGMVSKTLAVVEDVVLYDEYALILFDKYVKADSITSETVKISSEDLTECNFVLEAVNGAAQGDVVLASQYKLKFENHNFISGY